MGATGFEPVQSPCDTGSLLVANLSFASKFKFRPYSKSSAFATQPCAQSLTFNRKVYKRHYVMISLRYDALFLKSSIPPLFYEKPFSLQGTTRTDRRVFSASFPFLNVATQARTGTRSVNSRVH